MKLEIGQFARLKSGYICKIININDFSDDARFLYSDFFVFFEHITHYPF